MIHLSSSKTPNVLFRCFLPIEPVYSLSSKWSNKHKNIKHKKAVWYFVKSLGPSIGHTNRKEEESKSVLSLSFLACQTIFWNSKGINFLQRVLIANRRNLVIIYVPVNVLHVYKRQRRHALEWNDLRLINHYEPSPPNHTVRFFFMPWDLVYAWIVPKTSHAGYQ